MDKINFTVEALIAGDCCRPLQTAAIGAVASLSRGENPAGEPVVRVRHPLHLGWSFG